MTKHFETYISKPGLGPLLGLLSIRPVHSRKALQKLAYLLQEGEGVPLGLDYRMYYYGPFSSQLDSRLQMLELLGLVEVEKDLNAVPTYSLSEDTGELAIDSDLMDRIRSVVNKFGQRPPIELELLTTVHFLASQNSGADYDQIFQKLQAWKGSKYGRRQMENAIDELREAGYIGS